MRSLEPAHAELFATFADDPSSGGLPEALRGDRTQLTAADLEGWCRAHPAWPDEAAPYKHLLPRILQLIAEGVPLTAQGLTWKRQESALVTAGYLGWPSDEARALQRYARALWQALLEGDLQAWDAADILRLVSRLVPEETADLLGPLSVREHARVRRALVAELHLVEGQLDGWGGQSGSRRRALEAAFRAGMISATDFASRAGHPAEEAVRIWFCDPWRGVELSKDLASARGADQSTYRRRLQRWKRSIQG